MIYIYVSGIPSFFLEEKKTSIIVPDREVEECNTFPSEIEECVQRSLDWVAFFCRIGGMNSLQNKDGLPNSGAESDVPRIGMRSCLDAYIMRYHLGDGQKTSQR